jgi:hypothetical protein
MGKWQPGKLIASRLRFGFADFTLELGSEMLLSTGLTVHPESGNQERVAPDMLLVTTLYIGYPTRIFILKKT